jgi:uncharacterized protein YdeI (YjbR/CyaY-like superfamily)
LSTDAVEIHKGLPIHLFANKEEWLDWLENNHADAAGIWIKLAKKGSGLTTVSYEEARDSGLRYGWIDGLINKWDNACYLTRFTPRKAKSVWSKINRGIVEDLIEQKLMHPAGMVHVEAAKADGRWDAAYAGQSTITVPEDFQSALEKNPTAAHFFANLDGANRYAFLYRIHTAAKPETRAARIEKFIAMLNAGDVFHPKK